MELSNLDTIIREYFGTKIEKIVSLSGGISFETKRIDLEDKRQIVFREGNDYVNSGNRPIIIRDVFEREKFFYDTVSNAIDIDCPQVVVIDDKHKYSSTTFELYTYLNGVPLNEIFEELEAKEQDEVYKEIGRLTAQMNNLKINPEHKFIKQRGNWNDYFSNRLRERIIPLVKNNLISMEEVTYICLKARLLVGEERDLSFLHLDVRLNNFLWNDGISAVLDAENSEWGDLYFELARLDAYKILNQSLIEGYLEKSNLHQIDFECISYKLYKLEGIAFLTNVFLNEIDMEETEREYYRSSFIALKADILLSLSVQLSKD